MPYLLFLKKKQQKKKQQNLQMSSDENYGHHKVAQGTALLFFGTAIFFGTARLVKMQRCIRKYKGESIG